MGTVPTDVAALLDEAWHLVRRKHFDAEMMLELLESLPQDDLRVQIRGAITHARLVTARALSGDPYEIDIARSATTRVVELLEWHILIGVDEQLGALRDQVEQSGFDLLLLAKTLDELPSHVGAEISTMIGRARLCIIEVSFGRRRYKPLLRYTIKRLIELLEKQGVS